MNHILKLQTLKSSNFNGEFEQAFASTISTICPTGNIDSPEDPQ